MRPLDSAKAPEEQSLSNKPAKPESDAILADAHQQGFEEVGRSCVSSEV
jgi:hypothetical protein